MMVGAYNDREEVIVDKTIMIDDMVIVIMFDKLHGSDNNSYW